MYIKKMIIEGFKSSRDLVATASDGEVRDGMGYPVRKLRRPQTSTLPMQQHLEHGHPWGAKKTLVMREVPEDSVKDLLSNKESLAPCDIAVFVHDSHSWSMDFDYGEPCWTSLFGNHPLCPQTQSSTL